MIFEQSDLLSDRLALPETLLVAFSAWLLVDKSGADSCAGQMKASLGTRDRLAHLAWYTL